MTAITVIVAVLERLVGDDAETTKLLDDLKTELAADEVKLAADDTAIAALGDRLTKLEEAGSGGSVDLTPINDEIAALTARVTTIENDTVPGDVANQITMLQTDLKALQDRVAADDAAAGVLNPGAGGGTSDPATIVLGSLSPATATVGDAYSAIVGTSGGVAPVSFSLASGALPAGLSLAAGGQISGTPTTAGDFQFSLQAHDANGNSGQGAFDLIVSDPAAQATAATGAGADAANPTAAADASA